MTLLLILTLALQTSERPKVLVTVPSLAALTREVAGDAVEIVPLASPGEDPHFVLPTPNLMRTAHDGAAIVEVGLALDVWMDQIVQGSGNPRLASGQPGRIIATANVPVLEVPQRPGDRSQGDIHPQGNPHLWLDPVRAKMIARNIADGLGRAFPERAAEFEANRASFEQRINTALYGDELVRLLGAETLDRYAMAGTLQQFLAERQFRGAPLFDRAGGWLARARPLAGRKVVEFHKVWCYFAQTFGFALVGTIEEFPGISPGPSHITALEDRMRAQQVGLVLVDNFYDLRLPQTVADATGARVVVLPSQVGSMETVTYFDLVEKILSLLMETPPGE